jgi:hypothetical protein
LWADVFGNADECDVARAAAGGFGGAGDAFLNEAKIIGNRHGDFILHHGTSAEPGADGLLEIQIEASITPLRFRSTL